MIYTCGLIPAITSPIIQAGTPSIAYRKDWVKLAACPTMTCYIYIEPYCHWDFAGPSLLHLHAKHLSHLKLHNTYVLCVHQCNALNEHDSQPTYFSNPLICSMNSYMEDRPESLDKSLLLCLLVSTPSSHLWNKVAMTILTAGSPPTLPDHIIISSVANQPTF